MRQQIEGDIEALLGLAAAGELDSDDKRVIAPVALHPELWELKWHFAGRRELRQYHTEPPSNPSLLVAVHRHLKKLSGTKRQIFETQNQAMAQGKLQHMAGERTEWGTRP
ncbi:MAG: hypothetical protein EAS51_05255 [Microbacteriaceae bacterium]|nr:MAG: hypothetical protein EAS51_05255 [Microbacteriaceae bacterium]